MSAQRKLITWSLLALFSGLYVGGQALHLLPGCGHCDSHCAFNSAVASLDHSHGPLDNHHAHRASARHAVSAHCRHAHREPPSQQRHGADQQQRATCDPCGANCAICTFLAQGVSPAVVTPPFCLVERVIACPPPLVERRESTGPFLAYGSRAPPRCLLAAV